MLRRWTAADLAPFAALNADPVVMEHFPAPLTRAESDAFVARVEAGFDEHGFGLWAVERRTAVLGFTGLACRGPTCRRARASRSAGAWPGRLGARARHRGRARRGRSTPRAAGVGEVVSFTATTNVRSQRVMQRLGMTHDPAGDFDHPALPEGSPLRRHVLYRLPAGAAERPRAAPTDVDPDRLVVQRGRARRGRRDLGGGLGTASDRTT